MVVDQPLDLVRSRASAIGDGSYGDFVAAFPFDYYRRRVRELGFVGLGRVLDVGCGFGHWTAALGEVNAEAVGVDRSADRLAIAAEVRHALALDNVTFELGEAAALPYPDASFNGLFCYSVFMFLDRDAALAEFRRVLAPGARLYVNTAARGWWLKLWLESLRGPAGTRRSAFHGLFRGGGSTPPHAVSRLGARRLLQDGWSAVASDFDGQLGRKGSKLQPAPYAPRFLGLDSVVEFTAVRSEGTTARRTWVDEDATEQALQLAARTRTRLTYEFSSPLTRHPQPRPVVDLVGNCNQAAVRRALGRARLVDRAAVLRTLFGELVASLDDAEDQILACTTFAQQHFFHHFGGQPMLEGRPVQDPIASLLLEVGRCGASAAFLVDLFECNGVPARLVGGAAHTWPEILCGERWVIADASLYPPGILPRNESGRLLTTEEAMAEPRLLDQPPSYVNYHYEYVDAFLAEYPETRDALERWLRWPLLPSAGYFGSTLFADTPCVQRHRKIGGVSEWSAMPDFGWSKLETETVDAPSVPVDQRPSQARDLRIEGERLAWQPSIDVAGRPVRYRVVVAHESRGWEYDAIPVGSTLPVPGEAVVTSDPYVSAASVASLGDFVTVIAENPAWMGADVFYLPSRELRLAAER